MNRQASEREERPDGEARVPAPLTIPTRWKDNDVYGHVNNVEYYAFFDTVINALADHARAGSTSTAAT